MAGLGFEPLDAFLPVGNGIRIEKVHPVPVAGKVFLLQGSCGKQSSADAVRIHGLIIVAGEARLQKAHGQGVWIDVDRKSVFFPVVDKAFRNRIVPVGPVVFGYAEEGAQRAGGVGGGDGCAFVIAKAGQSNEAADDLRAQGLESGETGHAAQKTVIAQVLSIVDATECIRRVALQSR